MDTQMLQNALIRKDHKHKWLVDKGFKKYGRKVDEALAQSMFSAEPFNPRIKQLLEITRPQQK